MLYFLLIIIAVGVLLASEAGQNLLALLIKLAIIGGLLYLGFWIVVIATAFLNTDAGKSFTNSEPFQSIMGFILFVAICFVIGYYVIKERKRNKELWGLKQEQKEQREGAETKVRIKKLKKLNDKLAYLLYFKSKAKTKKDDKETDGD